MPTIRQLDPHVADLIAAGEVVERPASVVKELIENALDAGATAITVEIQKGGLTYVGVTDNGSGMEAEDAKLAFQRHATSKLRTGRDLEAIGTLGFRGEALAAISAVSRIELRTRRPDAAEGTEVTLEAGEVTDIRPVGCPAGTAIVVRDLFFNTPARLKFMKSDRAEAAAITAMLVSIALSHPGVSFRYIRDGKEEHHTPGDGSVRSGIYTLLGRDFAKGLLEVSGEDEFVTVTGFVTAPANAKGNRSGQHFYVNGRLVRSRLLQAALEQAYKNVQLSGKFPGCVLYLTLGLGAVDVNVHPAKTEVKFVEEKRVFDGVYYGVLSALEQGSFLPELTLSRDTQKVLHTPLTPTPQEARPSGAGIYQPPVSPDTGMLQDVGAVLYQGRIPLPNTMPAPESTPYRIISTHPVGTAAPGRPLHASDVVEGWHRPQTVEADGDEAGINTGAEETATPDEGRGRPGAVVPTEDSTPVLEGQDDVGLVPYRVVGEALGTYILVEQGDTLRFIDKHAAHERIIFDRLRAGDYTAMAQALLTPMTVDLGPEHTAVLMDHQEILEGFGFELTQFGQGTVALRQVPGDIDLDEMAGFLTELAAGLALGRTPNPNDIRDEVFHTMACKAAIKAGRRSEPEDLHALAGQVLDGTVQYCPHGRPVSMILTRDVLDKQVKRG